MHLTLQKTAATDANNPIRVTLSTGSCKFEAKMERSSSWLIIAGCFGAMAVAMGAWAAHGLAADPAAQRLADMPSRYQMLHAVAPPSLSALPPSSGWAARTLGAARCFTAAGVILFCGTLYGIAAGFGAPFPGAAPLGGVALIAGWLSIAATGVARLAADRPDQTDKIS